MRFTLILFISLSLIVGNYALIPSNCNQDSDCSEDVCVPFTASAHNQKQSIKYCGRSVGSCGQLCLPILNMRCYNGTCYSILGNKSLGDKCSSSVGECGYQLSCFRKKCTGNIGAPCNGTSDCLTTSTCVNSRCFRPFLEGEKCEAQDQCRAPLFCRNGVCAHILKNNGESCNKDADCKSDHCPNGKCETYSRGQCTNDSDCGSNEWCYAGGRCCQMNTPKDAPCRSGKIRT